MKQRWLFGLGAVAGAAAAGVAVAKLRQGALEMGDRARRLQQAQAGKGKNIVILGAGFGGINTAASLLQKLPAESGWKVTLVDRRNYFLFTPLLYHAASGLVDPSSILFPVRSLSRAPHFNFREASVLAVDFRRQCVYLDDGQVPYDYLVVALGSVPNFFGQDEALRDALTLKSTPDAIAIRNRIIDAFERADVEGDPAERQRCLTFVIVGGGATGVELAGAVRGLIKGTLARQYPRITEGDTRIILLEAMPKILGGVPEDMAQYASQRLQELGVEIRLNAPVERVEPEGLQLKDGEWIPSRTVVWAAGVRPAPVAASLEVPKVKGGRIQVDEFLEVPGISGVFAIGDVAAFTDPATGKPLPPNAQVAVQEAKALADILLARMEGKPAQPFTYHYKGELLSLGRHEAIADLKGKRLTGFPAWLVWRAFYLSQLMGFKNQLSVALDWTFAYVYQRDTVRLDIEKELPADVEEPVGAGR